MIAFDLDGVLVSDTLYRPNDSLINFMNQRDEFCYPNFYPKGDWCIITGRPQSPDMPYTERWIQRHFIHNPPKVLYHYCQDINFGAEYKASVLNEDLSISCLIESSERQVKVIQSLLTREVKILWFQYVLADLFSE